MARQAKIREKNGQWFSEAGGKGRYFGRVDAITLTAARRRLQAALDGGGEPPPTPEPKPPDKPSLSVKGLMGKFLAWLETHRSDRTHSERSRHLQRFAERYGDKEAVAITGSDLEAFTASLGHAPEYIRKHAVSIKAMYNRGVRMGWLPCDCKPFAQVEAIHVDAKPLLESDLPTDAEVKALLAHADAFMADVIALYHATGARTHELIEATVGDFQPNARTIVLGKHKRSHTMKSPVPRTITLNADAYAILQRHCQGRKPDEPILRNRKGYGYSRWEIARRFVTVRRHADIRQSITLYSFRHLWISDALMTGLDALLVARMAGTSVRMIERVYGHFRVQSFADAQARLDAMRARA